MAWNDVIGGVGQIETSLVESQKFNRKIGRFVVGENWNQEFDSELELQSKLCELCDADPHELTVFRAPSSLLDVINRTPFTKRKFLFVGDLVYWEMKLNSDFLALQSPFCEVSTADKLGTTRYPEILEVLDSSFSNYRNHYTANPLLDMSSATESYHNWAASVLDRNPENVVVVELDHKVAGLAVIEGNQEGTNEILLAGIGEEFQRRGAYVSLLSGVCGISAQRGYEQVVISTQSRNIAVQKAWAKIGFSPVLSIDTFHSLPC